MHTGANHTGQWTRAEHCSLCCTTLDCPNCRLHRAALCATVRGHSTAPNMSRWWHWNDYQVRSHHSSGENSWSDSTLEPAPVIGKKQSFFGWLPSYCIYPSTAHYLVCCLYPVLRSWCCQGWHWIHSRNIWVSLCSSHCSRCLQQSTKQGSLPSQSLHSGRQLYSRVSAWWS